MRETRLHPNLLTDWHDASVGISPRTTQPITTNRHLSSKWAAIFLVRSLYWVYPTDIAGVTFGELPEDNPRFAVAKTLLLLVPGITRDSQDNSSFKNRELECCVTVMWTNLRLWNFKTRLKVVTETKSMKPRPKLRPQFSLSKPISRTRPWSWDHIPALQP